MSDNAIEPLEVIQLVEHYVYVERRDAAQYTNREPFDTSGVWSLHQLARDIYASGVKDGAAQEAERSWRQRDRDREADLASNVIPVPLAEDGVDV